jgi:O-antigen/teichoic acid export membrane protein
MSKYVEELHTKEDTSSVWDSVLFFLGLVLIVSLVGIVFWVAV